MARMVPPIMGSGAPPGERLVFERLRDDPDTTDWTVLHSLNIARHPTQSRGEADFIVVIPSKGLVCIEVKSHRTITRDAEGMWHLGAEKTEVRGPFRQAEDALNAVLEHLSRSPRMQRVPAASMVILTSAAFNSAPAAIDWHDWQLVDARRLLTSSLGTHVLRAINGQRDVLATSRSTKWFDPVSGQPDREQSARIVNALRPVFECCEPALMIADSVRSEALRLTEEQFEAIDAMEANQRVVFDGLAGTGKTVLAVEAARRAAGSGARVLVVCFNRLLADELTATLGPSGVTVDTLPRLMLRISGLTVPDGPGEQFWRHDLPARTLEHLLDGHGTEHRPYDVVIADEVQDLLSPAYLDVLDLLCAGGLAGGCWRFFGDGLQAIYGGSSGIDQVLLARGRTSVFKLHRNCRNPRSLAQSVESLCELTPERSWRSILRADPPQIEGAPRRSIMLHFWSDAAEQSAQLCKAVETFMSTYRLPPYDIVILSSRSDEQSAAARLGKAGGRDLVPWQKARAGQIRYASIHSFKGLDALAVILTDMDDVGSSDRGRPLFYVGLTRAIGWAVVLASTRAREQLRQMLA